MTSMMRDVVLKGTATKAKTLGRLDLAGKTGTTNNNIDAWFAGYNPKQVAVAWIGFDQPRTLGKDETGGKAALPIWIRYMFTALSGMPDVPYKVPDGVMQVKIDAATGALINEGDAGIYEYFYHENPPPSHEYVLPPMEEPTQADFPENAVPDNMIDNPLQPAPPDFPPKQEKDDKDDSVAAPVNSKKETTEASVGKPKSGAAAAAGILNPSGN